MDRSPAESVSRHVKVEFEETTEGVKVTETFDPENENTEKMQRGGWQAILDNFKNTLSPVRSHVRPQVSEFERPRYGVCERK